MDSGLSTRSYPKLDGIGTQGWVIGSRSYGNFQGAGCALALGGGCHNLQFMITYRQSLVDGSTFGNLIAVDQPCHCGCKEDAEKVLADWVNQARESKIPQLQKMAMTVLAYRRGILSWYDCHISTAKVEGINNKIKVMKRNAYGFRDERYFKLRLYALHDCRITRNVG